MNQFHQFTYKKIGLLHFEKANAGEVNKPEYRSFIKILFLRAGCNITIDFREYQLKQDALFFINVSQWCQLYTEHSCSGSLLYYNRDFYCVEIHDREVSCDGILYNNVYDIPVVYLSAIQSRQVQSIIEEIGREFINDDTSMEEMLRILLKELIIRSTRIWKAEHDLATAEAKQDIEFLRKFSQLVELHFRERHTVADYASMLNVTSKALHKRITQYGHPGPNELIKERIMLEAKRLLAHTNLSVKEIGYNLGYDDPAYFVRLFTKQAGVSPMTFRTQYRQP